MSLLPHVLGYKYPHRILDQDFGLALTPDDLLTAVAAPILSRDYFRPWRQLTAATRDIGSTIKVDKDKFQVKLDVQHFAPEEITVKTADGYIMVEGKHEEKKDDHGYISRQFMRRYALPEGCKPEAVESKLSSDGVLMVVAPKTAPALKDERSVPISQTGPVRKEVTETRRYAVPEGCKPESVESKLSSDGVLTVVAPKTSPALKDERSVLISQTGPLRKEIKETRLCAVPEGCKPESVESKLSSDGVVTVVAPKTAPTLKDERSVPISQTGPVRKEIKETRLCAVPEGCKPESVESKLSSDGVLTVVAAKTAPTLKDERSVPISQTGPVRKEIKETRLFAVPEGCKPESIESKLSSDGVLTVVAPKTASALKDERSVPISQTGAVRKEIKDQSNTDSAKSRQKK